MFLKQQPIKKAILRFLGPKAYCKHMLASHHAAANYKKEVTKMTTVLLFPAQEGFFSKKRGILTTVSWGTDITLHDRISTSLSSAKKTVMNVDYVKVQKLKEFFWLLKA